MMLRAFSFMMGSEWKVGGMEKRMMGNGHEGPGGGVRFLVILEKSRLGEDAGLATVLT